MPYRVDVARAGDTALDRLVELGGVAPEHVARALGVDDLSISRGPGRVCWRSRRC